MRLRTLGMACLGIGLVHAADNSPLSQYRGLTLGSSVAVAAKVAGMEPSEAKAIQRRPVLIQELEWQPRKSYAANYSTEPVKEVVLSFYDGQLYQMVAKYDRFRTEGMTPEDLIEAISQVYGTATRPVAAELMVGSSVYPRAAEVLARWETPEYSCNLVRPAGEPEFSMILFSKRLNGLAHTASIEAAKIAEQEAPQREEALRKTQQQEQQLLLDKARLANKPAFRP
jgi:hypothetical protein